MTPSTAIVTGAPAVPAAAAGAPPAAAAADAAVDTAALQRQIEELKEQSAEALRTAQFWADRAKEKPAAKASEPAEDEPDVLEAITTRGAKGFDELASRRGFIKKEEVEGLINSRAATLSKEQELMGEYPDLKKKDSEFFKATALAYGELVKGGTPQAIAMEMAARQTELAFIRGGKIKLPGGEAGKEEKEALRLARIRAQAGEGGDRRPAGGTEEDEELTAEQKHIADRMGISHEAYAKRAKAGVAMGGGRK
jgi:hypothetical protein